jgi:hypothetical protein
VFFAEKHTGANIADIVRKAVGEYGCDASSMTTDNASNMDTCATALRLDASFKGICHVYCIAHTIQLAIRDAFEEKVWLCVALVSCFVMVCICW